MKLLYDTVERILEILPLKSLARLKLVSKQWKSMIEAPYFQKKLLIRRQSQDPDILIINPLEYDNPLESDRYSKIIDENVTRMFQMASSDLIKLPNLCPPRKPIPLESCPVFLYYTYRITASCDGIICYYNFYSCIYVVNPITRWSRSVPQSRYQALVLDKYRQDVWEDKEHEIKDYNLGFGRDKFTDTYKLVWLYNSFMLRLRNATACEVFDFSNNSWSYVTAAPCLISAYQIPVYFDGSLHWFTDENITEIKILSFDLHTETFHILSKTPFAEADSKKIVMCNLDNRLCVSQKEWPRQDIWLLNNSGMTWEKIYSLDVQNDSHLFSTNDTLVLHSEYIFCVIPLAVFASFHY